jgi:hypothetical protein
MYQLNNQLPAPYELNQAPQPPQNYAKGGHAKGKMIIAHFSPNELNVMDHLQGKEERCPKSGVRTYTHLEELLKNPHLKEKVHEHARKHHAHGGSTYGVPELEHLAAGGRHGDTELSMICHHTHQLFNQFAGHATRNPHTGHPEYWSLGGALGGLWNTVKGGAGQAWDAAKNYGGQALNAVKGGLQTAAPALGRMAGNLLEARFPGIGGKIGSGLANAAGNYFGEGAPQDQTSQAIGQGITSGAQAYQGGLGAREALGHGLQKTGAHMPQSGLGGALQRGGAEMSQGAGMGQAMRSGAGQAYQNMGGGQGLTNAANNIMAARPGGIPGMKQAGMDEMQKYGNQFYPG